MPGVRRDAVGQRVAHLQLVNPALMDVHSPAALDQGLAVARDVIGEVHPRRYRLPDIELDERITLGRKHDVQRSPRRHAALLREKPVIVRVADSQVQREPPRDSPAVLQVRPEIIDGTGRIRGVALGVDLERNAVSEDEDVVAGGPSVNRRSIRVGAGRVVEPDLEVMVAPQESRLVPIDDPFDPFAALVLSCRGDHVQARDDAGELIAGRDVVRSPVASIVPVPEPILERHELVAPGHLPFHLARVNGNIGHLAGLPRRKLSRGLIASLTQMLIEADNPCGGADLLRQFDRGKPLNLPGDGRRSIGVEPPQAEIVVPASTCLHVEPQLVRDDAAAQFGGSIPPHGNGAAAGDALRPQLVIKVVALHPLARLNQRAAAVEVVAARLDDDRDLNATARGFRRIADAGDRGLLEDAGIKPVAALVAAFWRGGHHAIQLLPGVAVLAEGSEQRVCGRLAHVKVGAHTGRQDHHRLQTGPARGNQVQGFPRQLGAGGCGRHVHDRRGPGDGDGLRQRADFHHHVHFRCEAGRHPQARPLQSLKAREHVLDRIGPERQLRQAIFAALVADGDHLRDL